MAHIQDGLTPDERVAQKRKLRRFSKLPVIGHFADRDVLFNNIIQAYEATGILYTLIFENCIGKTRSAGGVVWEYQNGMHHIKYVSYYIRVKDKQDAMKFSSFA